MSLCKKDVTRLLTHWSYIFPALSHRFLGYPQAEIWQMFLLYSCNQILKGSHNSWHIANWSHWNKIHVAISMKKIQLFYQENAPSNLHSTIWQYCVQTKMLSSTATVDAMASLPVYNGYPLKSGETQVVLKVVWKNYIFYGSSCLKQKIAI